MLTFVGLGLYDERSITVAGRDAIAAADRTFAEFYTSRLGGATVADLEDYHAVDIEVRDRDGVEVDPDPVLSAARTERVAFLVAGDPMISTTHVDLRLRAADRGIDTRIVHGTSAATAAASLTGLQNYRFGKATTVPFPRSRRTQTDAASNDGKPVPTSVVETIEGNRQRGLHTLIYLDIRADRSEYMTADRGADLLARNYENVLAVAICRAGSPDPVVVADRLSALAERDFGDPLHLLVVPGDLHHVERDALREFGGAPGEILDGP